MDSRDLFVYVGFVFVAHIRLQVEAYMNEQIKSTNKHIENGHFVMCVGTFVVSNHLFCHKYTYDGVQSLQTFSENKNRLMLICKTAVCCK